MAAKSANYGLSKPTSEEFYDIEVQNANMDLIDTALKNVDDRVEQAFQSASNGKSAIKAAITGADPDIVIPTDATFEQLASAIGQIETGVDTSDATITPEQMLNGSIGYGKDGKVVGTIPTKSAETYIPSTTDQIIEAGLFLGGVQIIKGDANLIPANIKKDVQIYDMIGTAEGGAALNVFVGLNPPETYEGIWIQTEEAITSIISDLELWFANAWNDTSLVSYADTPFAPGNLRPTLVAVGTALYLMGGGNSANNYKYNTLTNTWTKMSDIPYGVYGHTAVAVSTDIYIMGGYVTGQGYRNYNYKYDTLSDTWIELSPMLYSLMYHTAVSIGSDIYVMGGRVSSSTVDCNYKYDILSDTWTAMKVMPYAFAYHTAVAVGSDIYIMGGQSNRNDYNFKYNTLTDVWTTILRPVPYNVYYHTAVAVGTDIYIMGGDTLSGNGMNNYKYNVLTDLWTAMTYVPYQAHNHVAVYTNNAIHIMAGTNPVNSVATVYNRRYNFTSKQYPNGTVVIYKTNGMSGTYAAEFVTPAERFPGIFNRLLTGFNNVYMYSGGTLQENLPTYYGDGSAWVKFKG